MKKQEVIDIIASHKNELRQMGGASLELFGSVVRDEATETSDVDLMATFDKQIGLFEFYRRATVPGKDPWRAQG